MSVVRPLVAMAAVVATHLLLPLTVPLAVWSGPVGTPLRLGTALLLGVVSCVVLASLRTPAAVPARVGLIAVGLRTPARGRGRLAGQVLVEECAFRGILLALLASAFGLAAGVIASTVAFALWHARRGTRVVLSNTVNGLLFAASFLVLGGLPAAFLTHAAHNFALAGLRVGRLAKGGTRADARIG